MNDLIVLKIVFKSMWTPFVLFCIIALLYYLFIWPGLVACKILVPSQGLDLGPMAVKAPSPNH